jgi:DNA primase
VECVAFACELPADPEAKKHASSADVLHFDPPPSSLAAEPLAAAAPAVPLSKSLHPEIRGEDIFIKLGDREYRIRGLNKNTSYETLKINLRLKLDDDHYHQDNLDMARAKEREHFARAAAGETKLKEDVIKRDLSRLLLKLEELQEENIRRTLAPKAAQIPGMSEEERKEALELLQDPKLLDRILRDFDTCGVVGEDTNKLIGYLAALSRKFDKPLGVIIQSTSAAGKTTLMEAILSFVPEEEKIKYSAMTGQALFYLGETDIKNKILAIAEEEGAERATYALKLLQSEGELTIASTGKDSTTGRLVTETYHVEGPAMIFFTTTNIELDEELANRCLTLTVDESREQTRRIHELQREEETIEGYLRKKQAEAIRHTHCNAQRLLQTLPLHNPFARRLTFPDENTRLRRDQKKYLTLIRAIALLHQHQRPRRTLEGVEHVEVTLEDIVEANRLAGEILGRSLDEMPPQTRRFLDLLLSAVRQNCQEKQIEQPHYRFTQRDVRQWTGYSPPQVKRHLSKLVELEYILTHRGGRGQSFLYELLYTGEGKEGGKFIMGLIDPDKLKESGKIESEEVTYDNNRDIKNSHWDTPGTPQVQQWDIGGSLLQNGSKPNEHEPLEVMLTKNSEKHALATC